MSLWKLRLVALSSDCSPTVVHTYVFGNPAAAKAMHLRYTEMFLCRAVDTLAVLEGPGK